jgi:hypothetical protein
MSNCNFILMQPRSNSDLYCISCGHLYDPDLPICTCYDKEFKDSEEFVEDNGKSLKRKVIKYSVYKANKIKVGEW